MAHPEGLPPGARADGGQASSHATAPPLATDATPFGGFAHTSLESVTNTLSPFFDGPGWSAVFEPASTLNTPLAFPTPSQFVSPGGAMEGVPGVDPSATLRDGMNQFSPSIYTQWELDAGIQFLGAPTLPAEEGEVDHSQYEMGCNDRSFVTFSPEDCETAAPALTNPVGGQEAQNVPSRVRAEMAMPVLVPTPNRQRASRKQFHWLLWGCGRLREGVAHHMVG